MTRLPFLPASLILCGIYSSALWAEGESLGFDPSPFAIYRPVETVSKEEGIGVIRLDAAFFAGALENFADVRLVRRRGDESLEWPYLIEREDDPPPRRPSREIPTEVVSFEENEDGSIEIVTRLRPSGGDSDDRPSAAILRVETPLRDFQKTLEVFGSAADSPGEGDWESLVRGALIVDREAFIDFRRTAVELPENHHRSFRIVIREATDEQYSAIREVTRSVGNLTATTVEESASVRRRPFRIDGLKFFTRGERSDERPLGEEQVYPVEIVSTEEVGDPARTLIVLETGKAPIGSFILNTPDRNFRRRVTVEVPSTTDPESWRSVHRGSVHLYEVGALRDRKLDLVFSEVRSERVRLVVENLDNRPLRIDSVEGRGARYEMRFLTEPGDSWEVYYGAGENGVKKPGYDLGALARARGVGVAEEALPLGEVEENPRHVAGSGVAGEPWLEQPWVLHVLIALVVALLAVVLLRTARRVEEKTSRCSLD